jgi:hypothetical protein
MGPWAARTGSGPMRMCGDRDREGDDGRGAYGTYDRGRDVQKSVIISEVFSPPCLLFCPLMMMSLICSCRNKKIGAKLHIYL